MRLESNRVGKKELETTKRKEKKWRIPKEIHQSESPRSMQHLCNRIGVRNRVLLLVAAESFGNDSMEAWRFPKLSPIKSKSIESKSSKTRYEVILSSQWQPEKRKSDGNPGGPWKPSKTRYSVTESGSCLRRPNSKEVDTSTRIFTESNIDTVSPHPLDSTSVIDNIDGECR